MPGQVRSGRRMQRSETIGQHPPAVYSLPSIGALAARFTTHSLWHTAYASPSPVPKQRVHACMHHVSLCGSSTASGRRVFFVSTIPCSVVTLGMEMSKSSSACARARASASSSSSSSFSRIANGSLGFGVLAAEEKPVARSVSGSRASAVSGLREEAVRGRSPAAASSAPPPPGGSPAAAHQHMSMRAGSGARPSAPKPAAHAGLPWPAASTPCSSAQRIRPYGPHVQPQHQP